MVTGLDDYELLDSGDERKLERFGEVILDRPAPQALWPRRNPSGWRRAGATFKRRTGGNGDWSIHNQRLTDRWVMRMNGLSFELRLTNFGNVGLFPEHSGHWQWMADLIRTRKQPKILNLFAYTGGASMWCAAATARVTHVDAARSVNGWAQGNAGRSGIEEGAIRFLTDDVSKFVKREQRRQRTYDGIIIDPPTFGRGPKGELWKIEKDLHPLIRDCAALLSETPLFVLLTSHSPGVTPFVLRSLLDRLGPTMIEAGEMVLGGTAGAAVSAGSFARWSSIADST